MTHAERECAGRTGPIPGPHECSDLRLLAQCAWALTVFDEAVRKNAAAPQPSARGIPHGSRIGRSANSDHSQNSTQFDLAVLSTTSRLPDACCMLSCCLLPIILAHPQRRREIIGPEPNTLIADAIVTWLQDMHK